MKKKLFYILLCLTIIGIPIVIYCIKKKKFIKSDNVLKPSFDVKEKKYEEEKRKFTPLYTETTILPILSEDDLKKYKKIEEVEDIKKKKKVNKDNNNAKST